MSKAEISAVSPCFTVSDVSLSIAFYRDKLGFEVSFQQPDENPFFAILQRDGAQLFIKSEEGIAPMPNATRHRHLRWDAFLFVANPDALAAEFDARGVSFSFQLGDTQDGLRGFELRDPNGYMFFFGRPQ